MGEDDPASAAGAPSIKSGEREDHGLVGPLVLSLEEAEEEQHQPTLLEEAITPSWGRRPPYHDQEHLRVVVTPPRDLHREGAGHGGGGGRDDDASQGSSAPHSPASLGSPVEHLRHTVRQDEQHQQEEAAGGGGGERRKPSRPGVATVLQKIQKCKSTIEAGLLSGSRYLPCLATWWSPIPNLLACRLAKLQGGDYESYGDVVRGSRVIPMKTPLTKDLQKGYLPGTPDLLPIKHFTLESFIQDQRALGRTIGMVVDLSNHDCLYADDLPTFAADGLVYRHFQFVAKRLPEPESCKKVSEAITAFVMANSDKFVAIHCSYGFNRTGFVVCSYLIEELGVAPQEALDAFAQSRPPGVKHQDFVQELLARYQYIAPPPPPPPEEGGGSSDAVSGPQPVSPSLGGGAAAEGKRGGEGGGGGGEQKKGKPQSAEAGGQLPDQQQQQQAPLQQLFSPTSLRRGGAAMPVPQVHFHHEVNNDSLGMISGEALLAELEQELGSAQAAQLAASAQLKKTGMNGRPINCMLS